MLSQAKPHTKWGIEITTKVAWNSDWPLTASHHAVITVVLNLAEGTSSTLCLVCALDERRAIASHLGFQYLEDINAQQPVIADRFGVSPEQVHVQLGSPQVIITECVDIIGAEVLVKTDCDLLVVN